MFWLFYLCLTKCSLKTTILKKWKYFFFIILRLICVVCSALLKLRSTLFCVCTHNFFLMHSQADRLLDYFQFWAFINKTTMNIYVKIVVWTDAFISLGKISRSGIVGSSVVGVCIKIFYLVLGMIVSWIT